MPEMQNGVLGGEMKYNESVFYEDTKCLVTQDKYQYIVRSKPLPQGKHAYNKATYIQNGQKYLLWELCDCRHFFSKTSPQAMDILKRLAEAQ